MSEEQLNSQCVEVADILSTTFRHPLKLSAGEPLGGSDRSHVVRCHVLDAPTAVPQTVVVKQALGNGDQVYDPQVNSGPAVQLFNEWAALQFLGECFGGDSPVPRFYGGDRNSGVIVMEDLGVGHCLDKLLLGSDATAAEEAMVDLFRVIGRVHGVSAGKVTRYNEFRNALGPNQTGFVSDMAEHAQAFISSLHAVSVEVPPAVNTEIALCVQLAQEPGPFASLLHCDPCPDNSLLTPSGMKLLDFEFAQFGLALWDGAYSRIHFPTCWCVNRIPQRVTDRAEAAYREQLRQGCPEAADDTKFGRALVVGCACALFLTLSWAMPRVMEQDRTWGIATLRQRVLVRLNAFSRTVEEWGQLPASGETTRQMEEKLRELWLSDLEEMPFYPAFSQ